jgi:hypothetical protein
MTDEQKVDAFERHTKRVFDESVAALDGATRSRLTQARYRALAERERQQGVRLRWVLAPAGTLAAAALVAWLALWQAPQVGDSNLQATELTDLEILLAEEELEMLDEDLDFYAWLEEQPEFVDAGDGVG